MNIRRFRLDDGTYHVPCSPPQSHIIFSGEREAYLFTIRWLWPPKSPDLHPIEDLQRRQKALLVDLRFSTKSAFQAAKDQATHEMKRIWQRGPGFQLLDWFESNELLFIYIGPILDELPRVNIPSIPLGECGVHWIDRRY
ncbi:hypothetical protein DM02DRAFT_663581 [Periconia macrospinosa]|uniref:Uncharacterized protein n=1 Tax=Periconia macrospinosa TaxID=97972 RepID=A0A2V1D192_9PLEO|nr:hypothetical protein DM02DRAFT_663581 [Periconia macrospinosa]